MTTSSQRTHLRTGYEQFARVQEQVEKAKQLELIHDVHEMRSRGFSTRATAEALGASKSTVSRALQVDPSRIPARASRDALDVAAALVRELTPIVGVTLPNAAPAAKPSEVVIFDVMREALTTVKGDYAVLQRRAREAGDLEERQRIINATVELGRRVDAIDPRDQPAQLAMTKELREMHAAMRDLTDAA